MRKSRYRRPIYYYITFLTTTWLPFKDIYLLYYLPYYHLIAVWRHLFTILPSLLATSCCLKTFIYYITFLTTTWLLFEDIHLLYSFPYHHLVDVSRHSFTILPSLLPPGCCLKTFFATSPNYLLTTTWLLFKDIYLLHCLPYRHQTWALKKHWGRYLANFFLMITYHYWIKFVWLLLSMLQLTNF